MSEFRALLDVQEQDTALDQLRHRRATLLQGIELADVLRQLGDIAARHDVVQPERDTLEQRRAALERDVNEVERHAAEVDRRMRSGDVTATRELTAMVEQLESLKRRRSTLEDEELELMVGLEPLDAELALLGTAAAGLEERAAALRVEVARGEADIDVELAAASAARAAAADKVPAPLLSRYEQLRSRLGGVGAAALVGGSCGGCHLAISATELDRIRHEPPDAMVTCDQCGRILIR